MRALFAQLIDSALEQPRVLVHRDFHSRNLMLVGDDELAVIDFQDAVVGPVTYDLVSLLRDCYIQWPVAQVQDWALAYRSLLRTQGLLADIGRGSCSCAGSTGWACSGISRCWARLPASTCATASPPTSMICRW